MKSFLKEIESKFIELENNYCDACDRPMDQCICDEEEIAEISTSAGAGAYNTPNAFSKTGAGDDTVEVLGMKRVKKRVRESVNTPPSFKWKETGHQTPDSGEETSQDKFPFSSGEENWPNADQEYPVKFSNQPYGTSNIKDETVKHSSKVAEAMDRKYEQLIESYRTFATGDSKTTPEQKVKNTIKEVAKKLQEIETLVNHTSRLKTESGLSRTNIGSSADKALVKIAERLTKISERVRSLGE
jgi:hypothetical protein